VTLALIHHRARANELQCYWRAKQIHDPRHNFKRIGSGPDQGPSSFKDEDPEPEAEEGATATGEGEGDVNVEADVDATGRVAEAESGDADAEIEADINAGTVNSATKGTPAIVLNREVQPKVNGAAESA
jgi:hypothetical protein